MTVPKVPSRWDKPDADTACVRLATCSRFLTTALWPESIFDLRANFSKTEGDRDRRSGAASL